MKGNYVNYFFVLPAILYVIVLVFLPTVEVVYLSFTNPHGKFTLSNYEALPYFGLTHSIIDTAIVVTGALVLQLIIGLGVASLLTRAFYGKKALYVLSIIPLGIATVVAAVDFHYIFSPVGGFANSILKGIGVTPINWYSNQYLEMLTVIIADSWRNSPIFTLLMIAGYSSIPRDLYNAAAIDGAGIVRRFFNVTLPNIKRYIVIALIIRGVSEFNIFALPLIMIGYNPPLLTTLTYEFYSTTVTLYYSYAAATVLLAFIIGFIIIVLKIGGGRR
ncbi:sugar ABC transporter permease [Sulfolobales archaeon HS-7]|nr:sugar ABC transporter permease [Sulfolobales archaeon HS-7]